MTRQREWYLGNRERIAAERKERVSRDPESVKLKDHEQWLRTGQLWYLKNRTRVLAKNKARNKELRAIDPKSARIRERAYEIANRERIKNNKSSAYEKNREKHIARVSAWRGSNKGRVRAILLAYYERHKPKILAMNSLRTKRRKLAMPPWADRSAIEAVYAEAQRKTQETGVMHHVDHRMPLIHPSFSGLHVPWNLQVLTATQNLSKGNRI